MKLSKYSLKTDDKEIFSKSFSRVAKFEFVC